MTEGFNRERLGEDGGKAELDPCQEEWAALLKHMRKDTLEHFVRVLGPRVEERHPDLFDGPVPGVDEQGWKEMQYEMLAESVQDTFEALVLLYVRDHPLYSMDEEQEVVARRLYQFALRDTVEGLKQARREMQELEGEEPPLE